MAIDVKINPSQQKKSIGIKITDPTKRIYEFKLDVRRALNGDLMIFDHSDIDIVIIKEKKKIVSFAKSVMSEVVYGASSRLFEYLRKRGIIAYDSIQGGNVYGSLEGKILESKELDEVKASLYQISEWIETERPYFASNEAFEEMMDDIVLNPDELNSTELGEVPHEEEKGSITQNSIFSPYLYGRYTF